MKNNDIRQMIRVLRLHHYEVAERIRFLYKGIIINHNKNRANLH